MEEQLCHNFESKKIGKPQEVVKVPPGGRCGPVQNHLDLSWVCRDVSFLHYVTYQGDGVGVEYKKSLFSRRRGRTIPSCDSWL